MTAQAPDLVAAATGAARDDRDKPPRRPGRIRRSWEKYWYAYVMITPVVLVMALLVAYPLVKAIQLSFTNATEANSGNAVFGPSWHYVGIRNYIDVLSGKDVTGSLENFYGVLIRTIVWTFSCVALHYSIGLGLALLLNRKLRGRGFYRIMLLLPWAVPSYISAFAWRYLYNGNGVFNHLLEAIGIGPVDWLGKPYLALFSVIMVNVWLGVPFMMVALLGGLQSIPQDLYEAAEVDGATPWQRFRHITMPGLRPVSMTVLLLGVIWTFNMFNVIFLVTRGGPAGATDILVTFAFSAFRSVRNYAVASTYGVIILSLLVLFAAAYKRAMRTEGEVWS